MKYYNIRARSRKIRLTNKFVLLMIRAIRLKYSMSLEEWNGPELMMVLYSAALKQVAPTSHDLTSSSKTESVIDTIIPDPSDFILQMRTALPPVHKLKS